VRALTQFFNLLQQQPACLVTVHATRGSVPRESGTWMAVFCDVIVGTIGGGQLEFQAIEEARGCLGSGADGVRDASHGLVIRYALGPNLGQCCGGEVHLRYEWVSTTDLPALRLRLLSRHPPVALFGGGHVGKALIEVMGRLPFDVLWVDSRDEIFPPDLPGNVACEHSDPVQGAVAQLAPGAAVLIMSFSHAEDLDVVAACLLRQRLKADLSFIGLIGSKTKWATFSHRLAARGFSERELAGVTCPIGMEGITSKEPEVIAVSVAAQILQVVGKHRV
jgi:xanthine dehydrogenase accessory factor